MTRRTCHSVALAALLSLAAGASFAAPQEISGPPMPGVLVDESIAPIPEPATWAMMLLGLGGIGVILRRRRHTAAPAR